MYGQGISYTGELADLGVKTEVIEKSGSWYSYKEERIGQGRENVKQFLLDNPDIAETIAVEIKKNLGIVEGLDKEADGAEDSTENSDEKSASSME